MREGVVCHDMSLAYHAGNKLGVALNILAYKEERSTHLVAFEYVEYLCRILGVRAVVEGEGYAPLLGLTLLPTSADAHTKKMLAATNSAKQTRSMVTMIDI